MVLTWSARHLFQVFADAYERQSVLITTNLEGTVKILSQIDRGGLGPALL